MGLNSYSLNKRYFVTVKNKKTYVLFTGTYYLQEHDTFEDLTKCRQDARLTLGYPSITDEDMIVKSGCRKRLFEDHANDVNLSPKKMKTTENTGKYSYNI